MKWPLEWGSRIDMKKYQVKILVEEQRQFVCEAENEEEAEKKTYIEMQQRPLRNFPALSKGKGTVINVEEI